jgi:hypothetical protein
MVCGVLTWAMPAAATVCREKGNDLLLGGVSLEYDPTAGPTKFMVGCEQGGPDWVFLVPSCNKCLVTAKLLLQGVHGVTICTAEQRNYADMQLDRCTQGTRSMHVSHTWGLACS